jgi:uncharacterized protein YbjT (DUF2867 family)
MMKVILFGATGMIGQGVLRECLLDDDVERVLSIGRKATGQTHPKLEQLTRDDPSDLTTIEADLSGYDACFFCLGISSAGMKEAEYRRITYDMVVAVAGALVERCPRMTFIYISGAGTDSTERGRSMWARVKGETENALLKMPFKAVFMFRPGYIQPLHGIVSRTSLYRVAYAITSPLYPLLKGLPGFVTSTERLGRAMLAVAKRGHARPILESRDINDVADSK